MFRTLLKRFACLAPVVFAVPASAAFVGLPTLSLTASSFPHDFEASPLVGYQAIDELSVFDSAAAAYTPGSFQTPITAGDYLGLELHAPAGMYFHFKAPANALEPAHLAGQFVFSTTPGSYSGGTTVTVPPAYWDLDGDFEGVLDGSAKETTLVAPGGSAITVSFLQDVAPGASLTFDGISFTFNMPSSVSFSSPLYLSQLTFLGSARVPKDDPGAVLSLQPVPEPATGGALLGAATFAGLRRKRRRR